MLQKPQHKGARRGGLEGEEGEHTQHRFGFFYLPRRGKEKAKSTTARASNLLPLPQPWGKPTPPTTSFYSPSLYLNLLVISGVFSVSWLADQLLGCPPQNCKPCRCQAWRLTNEPRDSDRDISGLLDKRILQT